MPRKLLSKQNDDFFPMLAGFVVIVTAMVITLPSLISTKPVVSSPQAKTICENGQYQCDGTKIQGCFSGSWYTVQDCEDRGSCSLLKPSGPFNGYGCE